MIYAAFVQWMATTEAFGSEQGAFYCTVGFQGL